MATQILGKVKMVNRGEYNGSTTYEELDVVTYNGSSYSALLQTKGNAPTNTNYWALLAQKGDPGIQGDTGNGIASITKQESQEPGGTNTLTITETNGTTTNFNVKNGDGVTKANYEKALLKGSLEGNVITFDDGIEYPLFKFEGDGKSEQASLPSEYQAVEYIESTGTQYIDTNYINTGTMNVDMVCSVSKDKVQQGIFGANGTTIYISQLRLYTGENGDVNKLQYNYSNTNIINYTQAIANLNTTVKNKYSFGNGTFYINNVLITTYNVEILNSSRPSIIFGVRNHDGNADFLSKMKLYRLQIMDNNVRVRDFVPCYRISDNVIGLYDLVNDVFYTNQGTGVFIKGNNISIPSPDYPQEINSITGDIEVVRKNLFNSTIVEGDISNQNGEINLLENRLRTNDIIYLESGTYTINANGVNNVNIHKYLTNGSWQDALDHWETIPYTFTLNERKGVRFAFRKSNDSDVIPSSMTNIQLERGNQATDYDYEPYKGFTIPLGTTELCSIGNVKDELIIDTETGVVSKVGKITKEIFDGTQNLIWSNAYNSLLYINANIKNVSGNTIGCISNRLVGVKLSELDSNTNVVVQNISDTRILIKIDGVTNANEGIIFFTNNPTIFYYQLATPTTETITTLSSSDLEKLKALDGDNTYQVITNMGNMNIRLTYAKDVNKVIASLETRIAELETNS